MTAGMVRSGLGAIPAWLAIGAAALCAFLSAGAPRATITALAGGLALAISLTAPEIAAAFQ